MSFYQFLIILNARKVIALFALTITVVTTLVVSLTLPKTYEATTALVVNYQGSDPVTGSRIAAQLVPGYMATQVDIIYSQNVALKVVDKLGLYTNPEVIESFYAATDGKGEIRNWLASSMVESLTVTPSRESSVINLTYESSDPAYTALLANTFAEAYIDTNLELKIEPSKRTATWFKGQVDDLRTKLMESQRLLSEYQREKGIVSIDERMDVENSRLAQLSQQLVMAQAELFNFESQKQAIKSGKIETTGGNIALDPLIRDVKVALSRSEIKLAELRQRLSNKHPDYLSVQSEVINLRNKLKKELLSAKDRVDSNVVIAKQKVAELEKSMAEQKSSLLQINENRDRQSLLQRDVADAQQILSLATQRLSQTALEGSSSESDVSILNTAVAPIKPAKPNVLINLILSVFLGSVLAVGIALLLELMNRRVRTEDDVISGVGLPVLGEVLYSKIVTK